MRRIAPSSALLLGSSLLLNCQGVVDGARGAGSARGSAETPGAGGSGNASGTGGAPFTCEPTSAAIYAQIIAPSCTTARCHGALAPAATLDLSTADWLSKLVSVPAATCDRTLIVPGSPGDSFFHQKLVLDEPGCEGERMPVGEPLPAAQIACIESWIRALPPSSCETCGGATCVALSSDASHCGECGNVCPAGSGCRSGTCACAGALLACGDACVDPASDTKHCGGCDLACPSGASCREGRCECANELSACDSGCHDLTSDPEHCGACSNACEGAVCLQGACAASCAELAHCDGSCVDLATNPLNCGACGKPCDAGLACAGGVCVCPDGHGACGGTCVELRTDPRNCGSCGNACGPGATCVDGGCRCSDAIVSFAADVQPVFSAACNAAGCHTGARPKEGLSLEVGEAYANLVGVPASQCGDRLLVKPGDPGGSYLVQKLLGAELCSGSQMPKAGQGLPDAEFETVSNWICQGAPEN